MPAILLFAISCCIFHRNSSGYVITTLHLTQQFTHQNLKTNKNIDIIIHMTNMMDYQRYPNGQVNVYVLKLPSPFTAWPFWTFHNISHNMKALIILSHSWPPFLPLTCLHGNKNCGSVQPSGVFSWEKTPSRFSMQSTWPLQQVCRFSHGLITVRQKKMWT